MRRNVRTYKTRIAQSISSEYLRGFLLLFVRFVTRCWFISRWRATTLKGGAPCNRAFDTKYKYGQRVHKEIDFSPCNHAYSVVFRMRRNARRYIARIAQSISSQYLRGFLLLFVRFVTRCWFVFPMTRQGTYGRCLRAVKHLDGLYESTDSL